MPRSLAATLALAIAPAFALEAGTPPVPAAVLEARYVALAYDVGDGFVPAAFVVPPMEVTSRDREAVAAVRDRLERWGRYRIMDRIQDADLVVAVRAGRLGSIGFTVVGGGRGQAELVRGRGLDLEVSSPDDLLSVYAVSPGPGALLWRGQARKGLEGRDPRLLRDLRRAIEDASRTP